MDVSDATTSPNHRLRQERIGRNWRQQELAELLGTTPVTISRWEGGSQQPSLYFREKLCMLFGKGPEQLGLLPQESPDTSTVSEGTAIWKVPFSRNPFFTGRDRLLGHLHSVLSNQPTCAALTQSYGLHGLGGIGKTQLALEYAHQHRGEYTAVLWIQAETRTSLTASFVALAEVLGLPERAEKDHSQIVAAVLRWMNQHQGWLTIFDNVEDLSLLKSFLPTTNQGALLFTTRLQTLSTLAQLVELPPMTMQEGYDFLLTRTRRFYLGEESPAIDPQELAAAQQIVAQMGGLPLALEQAGAYIEAIQCRLWDYLQLFQAAQQRLLAEHEPSSDHPLSVSRTFALAFEQVQNHHPLAAALLTICAFLAPDAIPEMFFLQGASSLGSPFEALVTDPLAFAEVVKVLLSASLIQRDAATSSISIHRLVQVILRERMSEQERTVWLKRVSAALGAVFPEVTHDVWGQCELLLPHVLAVTAAISEQVEDQEVAEVLKKAADYLRDRGQYEQAEPLYQRALRIREQQLGPEHLDVAHSLHSLGLLYWRQGKYTEAEPLYQRALCIRELQLGPEHLDVAHSLHNLGILSWQQGKYAEARQLYHQALQIREQQLGPTHPQVAHSLNNLGILSWQQGKYAEAEPLYQRTLWIWEQQLGPEHPQVAEPLNNLGGLYCEQGKYAEAEPLFQRALRIWELQLGPEHPQVANLLNNLGLLYRQQGRYAEAEPLYQRALRIWELQLGPEHPQAAYPLTNLAELSYEQGKHAEAEPLYRRALRIWELQLGPEHPDVAEPLNGLANLFREQGKNTEAEPLYQRALSIRERHLGQHHPETAQTLHDLSIFQQKQGGLSEAIAFAERALSIRSQSLGDTHPKTATTRTLYIWLLQEQEGAEEDATSEQSEERIPDSCGEGLHAERAPLPLHEADPSFSENDLLQAFLDACCELHPLAWCRISDLWRTYQQWTASSQRRIPLSRRAFAAQVRARGCCADRTSTARIWRGIRLVNKNM